MKPRLRPRLFGCARSKEAQRTCARGIRLIPEAAQLPGSTADTVAAQAGSPRPSFTGDPPSTADAPEAGGRPPASLPPQSRRQRTADTARDVPGTQYLSAAAHRTSIKQDRGRWGLEATWGSERGARMRRGKVALPQSLKDQCHQSWHRARDPDSDPRGVLGGGAPKRGAGPTGALGLAPLTLGKVMSTLPHGVEPSK